MDNLVVARLNVYCPKFVITRNAELQKVFESTDYCVKVFSMRQYSAWNKNYMLRFEFEGPQNISPIQEETEEQRNYNDDTFEFTAVSKEERFDVQLTENNDVVSTAVTTHSAQKSHGSSISDTKSSIPTGSAETQSHKTTDGGLGDVVLGREGLRVKIELKIQHALHHCVHGEEIKCPYYKDAAEIHKVNPTIEEIKPYYIKDQGNNLHVFSKTVTVPGQHQFWCPECKFHMNEGIMKSINLYLKDPSSHAYEEYVIDHLSNRKCGAGCPLWKVCVKNEMHLTHTFVLKYADEGLVLHSGLNQDRIGTISKEFINYDKGEEIGSGGFGKVYKCGEVAIKEEHKRPLIIADKEIFKFVTRVNSNNVISMKEYIVGKIIDPEKEKRVFLFTMPYINERGLHKQFKTHKCIIEHMHHYPDEEEIIFKNFLILFLHVFQGLEYLHDNKIVHGDVKDANILVQQSCPCVSPFRCKCSSPGGVTYVLADLDLLCLDGRSVSGKYVEWTEAKLHEPAGTCGMKASELYFTGKDGEPCGSQKSDIWAGCLAMMNAFVGREDCEKTNKEIQKSARLLDFSQERPKDVPYLNQKANAIISEFKSLKDVNSLYQPCLDKLPHIYKKQLWTIMKASMEIIASGVRFLPQDRPTATEVTGKLIALL